MEYFYFLFFYFLFLGGLLPFGYNFSILPNTSYF
jgi:hypothetical protein